MSNDEMRDALIVIARGLGAMADAVAIAHDKLDALAATQAALAEAVGVITAALTALDEPPDTAALDARAPILN